MSTQRFTPEFKEEAVRQVVERGYGVPDVASRLGVSAHSLYKWLKAVSPDRSNRLQREFTVDEPNKVWVTDITYIRTWQGWLYLAVVVDLFARKVVGWSMKSSLSRELAMDALLMAVWRRKPADRVIVHSDQGSQ